MCINKENWDTFEYINNKHVIINRQNKDLLNEVEEVTLEKLQSIFKSSIIENN